jgi:dihydroorotate dehydrogenase electron transfer subunit
MKLTIRQQIFLKEKYLLLELLVPDSFKTASPGQFLHIRIEDSCDPLLRRPLSIHDIEKGRQKNQMVCRIIYEIVGKGTALLAQKKQLAEVDALGPLGKGFDLKKLVSCQKVYLVAGGMGIAPLYFLAKKIVQIQKTKPGIQTIVLIGAKTKNHILREKEFGDLGLKVHVATDDGSKGFKGKVTGLLKEILLSPQSQEPLAIAACGPKAMLAAIADIAHHAHIPTQVSLEEFMGCGLGACLGCVIRTTSGFERICHDGPVFDAEEILWKE